MSEGATLGADAAAQDAAGVTAGANTSDERPWTVYVIGGIGSGKSSVSARLAQLGAPVYDLDAAGHEALRLPEVKARLRAAFGEGIFDEDGEVMRPALAQAAFASKAGTSALNEITTAAIVRLLNAWRARRAAERACAVIVEVSAFDGPGGRFPDSDEILAVTSPLEERVRRAVAKGFPEADVRARVERQASDEERRVWADVVIENDGTPEELRMQVDAWWEGLQKRLAQ